MQHIQIKLFAGQPYPATLAPAIEVFHRWIQQQALPGLLVDVADYAHVPMGPGVLLIGHEFNVSLDEAGGRLGLLYNRKLAWEGTAQEALRSAYGIAVQAAALLEADPAFGGALQFRRDEFAVIFNDRLLYPNRAETLARVSPDLDAFAKEIFGGRSFRWEHDPDPRLRFTVTARPA